MTAYYLRLPATGAHPILSNSRDKVRATVLLLSFAAQHLHLLGQGFGTRIGATSRMQVLRCEILCSLGARISRIPSDGGTSGPSELGTVKKVVERKCRDFSFVKTPVDIEIGRLASSSQADERSWYAYASHRINFNRQSRKISWLRCVSTVQREARVKNIGRTTPCSVRITILLVILPCSARYVILLYNTSAVEVRWNAPP